jgi:hypothetical protein
MDKPQDPEAAETVQTTSVPAIDLPRLVRHLPDWQVVTIITEDFWEEVDCNGGGRRKILRGKCNCGQVVHVEINSPRTCRTDGKRIFYPDQPNSEWCVFRCRGCGQPIGDTCEAAAYGHNADVLARGEIATPITPKPQ